MANRKTLQDKFAAAFDKAEAASTVNGATSGMMKNRTQTPRVQAKTKLQQTLSNAATEGLEEVAATKLQSLAKKRTKKLNGK